MVIIDYKKSEHKQIIRELIQALKQGKVVAYPTDTSYGLAANVTNIRAINQLYKIKGRNFNKPIHIVVPSIAYAKKIVKWNVVADKLSNKFLPGPLTLVLKLKIKNEKLKILSSGTGFLGVRMPKNQIALDMAKFLKLPITTTSANRSGQGDCYSLDDILKQFNTVKIKPDIVINAGKLPKRKPSTLVKIDGDKIEILRKGPISEKEIIQTVNSKQ